MLLNPKPKSSWSLPDPIIKQLNKNIPLNLKETYKKVFKSSN